MRHGAPQSNNWIRGLTIVSYADRHTFVQASVAVSDNEDRLLTSGDTTDYDRQLVEERRLDSGRGRMLDLSAAFDMLQGYRHCRVVLRHHTALEVYSWHSVVFSGRNTFVEVRRGRPSFDSSVVCRMCWCWVLIQLMSRDIVCACLRGPYPDIRLPLIDGRLPTPVASFNVRKCCQLDAVQLGAEAEQRQT